MLDAAVAAKRAALPSDDAGDGLALVRQALLIALAQKEAEAAARTRRPTNSQHDLTPQELGRAPAFVMRSSRS
jgi:hypothetical protein